MASSTSTSEAANQDPRTSKAKTTEEMIQDLIHDSGAGRAQTQAEQSLQLQADGEGGFVHTRAAGETQRPEESGAGMAKSEGMKRSEGKEASPGQKDFARSSYEELESENRRLDAKVFELDAKITQLTNQNESFDGRDADSQVAINDLTRKKKALEQGYVRTVQERDDLRAKVRELELAMENNEKTISKFKTQILEYKKTIAAKTRREEHTADSVLKTKFDQIHFSLQSFVVKHFRDEWFNFEALPLWVRDWAGTYIPDARKLLGQYKIMIITSIITITLTEAFEAEKAFGRSASKPLSAARRLANLQPDDYPETKAWIEMTRKLLARHDSTLLEDADDLLVRRMVEQVFESLGKALRINWQSLEVQSDLGQIFWSCLEFYHLLRQQPAKFHIEMEEVMLPQGQLRDFEPECMEDINEQDMDDPRRRRLGMAVFPAIYKFGDENGVNLDKMTVISKAKMVTFQQPAERSSGRTLREAGGRQSRYSSAQNATEYFRPVDGNVSGRSSKRKR